MKKNNRKDRRHTLPPMSLETHVNVEKIENCEKHNLKVIYDAALFWSKYNGKAYLILEMFLLVATCNQNISTGEGYGCMITADKELHEKILSS